MDDEIPKDATPERKKAIAKALMQYEMKHACSEDNMSEEGEMEMEEGEFEMEEGESEIESQSDKDVEEGNTPPELIPIEKGKKKATKSAESKPVKEVKAGQKRTRAQAEIESDVESSGEDESSSESSLDSDMDTEELEELEA